MSDRLVSTTTGAPSAAGPGRSAAAIASRSASRSCTTQCCGPGRSGASHRPIAPVPQARSWITQRPVAGRRRRSVRDEIAGPGRSVGRLAEVEPSGAHPDLLDRHRAAPARTPDSTDVVVDQRESDARRSRAARRNRRRRSASPSQARSAAPSATGSPGGTRRPGACPVGAVTEGLRHTPDLGCHDRQATGQRLGDDHAVRLGAGRQHQQVGGGVAASEIGLGLRPRKAHPPVQPALSSPAAETFGERRVAVEAAHAHGSPSEGPVIARAHRAARHGPCRGSPPRRRAAPRRSRFPARGRRRRRRARRRARDRRAADRAREAFAGPTRWS